MTGCDGCDDCVRCMFPQPSPGETRSWAGCSVMIRGSRPHYALTHIPFINKLILATAALFHKQMWAHAKSTIFDQGKQGTQNIADIVILMAILGTS